MQSFFLLIIVLLQILGGVFFKGQTLNAAPIRIQINKGVVNPEPIAIVDLIGENNIAHKVTEIIRNNLKNSGLFLAINPAAFIQSPHSLWEDIRYDDWRLIKVHFVVSGSAEIDGDQVIIRFKLFDVFTKEVLFSHKIKSHINQFRTLAHKISDQIYARVTGEKGMFNTHIVYAESLPRETLGSHSIARKRLVRMDQDGANKISLTKGDTLVLTPRYSPDGKKIAFLSYKDHTRPRVVILNLNTKQSKSIKFGNGMTFAPRFSPDSEAIVFSLAKSGKTAIYVCPVSGGSPRRLTEHRSIDTSPCFSPDGNHIVFTSDRSGREHIYMMDRSGGNVQRLTYGDGKYSQPVWSQSGYISFTKQVGKQFFIGLIQPNGSGERLIAQGFLVEGADWSPNGRYIVFAKEGRGTQSKLYVVDLTGRFMRRLPTTRDSSDPTWSPLLSSELDELEHN